ncbi:hypothetical protein QWJ07_24480 [Frankia sp. RB7]|nr:hypothetical protein [Frankia sp. RB7]
MSRRPLLMMIIATVVICLAAAAVDAITILMRPVLPWFAWMLP